VTRTGGAGAAAGWATACRADELMPSSACS
jgi:hypothetical protein